LIVNSLILFYFILFIYLNVIIINSINILYAPEKGAYQLFTCAVKEAGASLCGLNIETRNAAMANSLMTTRPGLENPDPSAFVQGQFLELPPVEVEHGVEGYVFV